MTEQGFQPTTRTLGPTERADYLDTQTLAGGKGYFHEENAASHATDGSAKGKSPETPLVAAAGRGESGRQQQAHPRGESNRLHATGTTSNAAMTVQTSTPEGDGFDDMTNHDLMRLAKANNVELPKRANKAQMIAALRGK